MGIIANLSQAAQLSVFKWLSPAQIADVEARTASLDLSAPLQAAIDSGEPLFWPAGVYRHDATLVLKPGVNAYWHGAGRLTELRAGAAMAIQVRNPTLAEGYVAGFTATARDFTFDQNGLSVIPVSFDTAVAKAPISLGFRSTPPATELAPAEAWLGRAVGHTLCFIIASSWVGLVGEAKAQAATQYASGRRPHWALGTADVASPLAGVAAGTYDAYYVQVAEAIAAADPFPEIFVRVMWEQNLIPASTYFPWAAEAGQEANYIAAFRRVSGLLKAVSPRFKVIWCPHVTTYFSGSPVNPEPTYPGDDVVDIIGMDVYTIKVFDIDTGTVQSAVDNKFVSTYGLNWLVAFALTHNKPMAVDECGINVDNGEYFYSRIARLVRSNTTSHIGLWDQNNVGAPNFQDKLSNNQYPATSAQFLREFGPLTFSTPSAVQAGQDRVTYIPLVTTRPVTWKIISAPSGFYVRGNALAVSPALALGAYTVRVGATDVFGVTATHTLTVTVAATLDNWTPAAFASGDRDFWFDVSDAGTVTHSGGAVSALADKWGAHSASQATSANQPAYSATGRNNLPAITFDGTNDTLSLASPTTLAGSATARSIAAAAYAPSSVATGFKYFYGAGGSTADAVCRLGTGSGTLRVWGNEMFSTLDNVTDKDITVVARCPAVTAPAKQVQRINLNGTPCTAHSVLTTAVAPAYATLGARPNGSGASDYSTVALKEIFGLRRELSDFEAVIVEGYLAHKWGGVANLPADHAFKYAPPAVI